MACFSFAVSDGGLSSIPNCASDLPRSIFVIGNRDAVERAHEALADGMDVQFFVAIAESCDHVAILHDQDGGGVDRASAVLRRFQLRHRPAGLCGIDMLPMRARKYHRRRRKIDKAVRDADANRKPSGARLPTGCRHREFKLDGDIELA